MMTQLVFRGVFDIVGNDKVGLIVLTDTDCKRQFTVVCDRSIAVQLGLRQDEGISTVKLLPDVLWTLIKRYVDISFEVRINDVKDGEFSTCLCSVENSIAIPVRASDGILLSVIAGIPLLVSDHVFSKHSIPFKHVGASISVPLTALSTEMLKKALDDALAVEDYDKASHVRDELLRRDYKFD